MNLSGKEKRRTRELAMQVLFAWDAISKDDPETARQVTHDGSDNPVIRQLATDAARATWSQREMIDQRIERHAPNWPPRRQPGVDRNILRLAVYEMTNTSTPGKVVIDDMIEIARAYSTESSGGFVNAVLDAIYKEHNALLAGLPPAEVSPVAPPDGTQGQH